NQKRAEFTFERIHVGESFVIERMQKKALGKILRIVRSVPLIPNKRVKRIPVEPAQLRKCGFGTRRLTLSRKQHHAPPSSAKSACDIRWRMAVRVQFDPPVVKPRLSSHSKIEIRVFQSAASLRP